MMTVFFLSLPPSFSYYLSEVFLLFVSCLEDPDHLPLYKRENDERKGIFSEEERERERVLRSRRHLCSFSSSSSEFSLSSTIESFETDEIQLRNIRRLSFFISAD